jgi:hypothetical protein
LSIVYGLRKGAHGINTKWEKLYYKTRLAPRTLPNGVSNGEYTQNVSNDFNRIPSAVLNNQTNVSLVSLGSLTGMPTTVVIGDVSLGNKVQEFAFLNDVTRVGTFYRTSDGSLWFTVAKNQYPTLGGAVANFANDYFGGTIPPLRYQLATPIQLDAKYAKLRIKERR